MLIRQQTYDEFISAINLKQPNVRFMIENTSRNREFFSARFNGEWHHGFWDKEQCEKISNY